MNDSLGERMKRYEAVYHAHAVRRVPLVVRVDGRAFHTWTKARRCERPFDDQLRFRLVDAAEQTMSKLQGAVLGYCQSDEASFCLIDFKRVTSEPHFDHDIQKIVSTTASAFTKSFAESGDAAEFDCRAFTVPLDDVANYFLWRVRDWKRNSLQMLARAHFSHKELHEKDQPAMHEMLHSVGVNWAELPEHSKNGVFISRFIGRDSTARDSYVEMEKLWSPCLLRHMESEDS